LEYHRVALFSQFASEHRTEEILVASGAIGLVHNGDRNRIEIPNYAIKVLISD